MLANGWNELEVYQFSLKVVPTFINPNLYKEIIAYESRI